jgi:hypothetical protein
MNTLAYYKSLQITAVKSFIKWAQEINFNKQTNHLVIFLSSLNLWTSIIKETEEPSYLSCAETRRKVWLNLCLLEIYLAQCYKVFSSVIYKCS